MKVGTGGNLGLSREYHKKLFGPLFYTWWNCPLMLTTLNNTIFIVIYFHGASDIIVFKG